MLAARKPVSDVDEQAAFVRAALDRDEQWARAASQAYPYAVGDTSVPEAGVHWTWVAGENWEPVRPDPAIDEFVAPPGENCNLATVEQWPIGNWGIEGVPERFAPQTYANSIVEMDSSAAGHIARWDPHRVLAKVKADRAILDWCDRMDPGDGLGGLLAREARKIRRLLAQPYAGQDGWREEWQLSAPA